MAILSKKTITELAKNKKLLGDDYLVEKIRGSSYDLRIGTFFLKDSVERSNIISIEKEKDFDEIIKILPSDIITFLTLETVTIPNHICGTVFPINKLSSTGLLILNPGHIDPGFSGPISICAINLSKDIIYLSLKDPIFTIIFDTLDYETEPYDNKKTAMNRRDYELNFYKNKASKLSNSIFDLITTNNYESHLKKQISNILLKYLRNFALITGLIYTFYKIAKHFN